MAARVPDLRQSFAIEASEVGRISFCRQSSMVGRESRRKLAPNRIASYSMSRPRSFMFVSRLFRPVLDFLCRDAMQEAILVGVPSL
jgi:hypothetical protein